MGNQIVKLTTAFLGLGFLLSVLGCGTSANQSNQPSFASSNSDFGPDTQLGSQEKEAVSEQNDLVPGVREYPTPVTSGELVNQLGRLKPGPEMEKAITQLAERGDATVNEVEAHSTQYSSDFGWVHTSVRVLQKIDSENSRVLLRKFATGQIKVDNPSLQGWAARALIACDESQARALLSSTNDEVLEVAINSLRGKGSDEILLSSLRRHIESQNADTRWRAASIMASEAPPGRLAEIALISVKEALAQVSEIADLQALDPSSGHVNYEMTVGESNYQRYLSIVEQMQVKNTMLHQVAQELEGRARDIILLALAFRKDATVHKEIVRLVEDADAGMFRAWAASALEHTGSVDDLPLLRRLAESDPLVRRGGGLPVARKYPVRLCAQQTINAIEQLVSKKR